MQEANIEGPLRLQHDMRYLRGVPLEQDGNLVQVLRPRGTRPIVRQVVQGGEEKVLSLRMWARMLHRLGKLIPPTYYL